MRFSRLVQLDNVCRTLQEAAEYIQENGDLPLCQDLLQNGIQLLDQISGLLRQHRMDWKNTRPMEQLEQVKAGWQMPLPLTMGEQLQQLRRSFSDDISIQIRAVFFAELGGKWDSLDSVYRYMCSDPRFDPIVVLTPVFRSLQVNGKEKYEVVYEDYLTKMGIPFYDYRAYNLERDCPELAFTCQPYESVTLPAFWAQNIAKHTNLVYLPYYIPHIINSNNKDILCNMPIHRYAWRVAASSEKFARYYRKYSLCQGANLMVTGLPKMDYAIKLKENPCGIPKDWRGKVQSRTVILWNTWYDGKLSSLDLLEQMLPWFAEHHDFALIWRPHPMSEAVMKLHQPEQFHKLKKMMDIVAASDHMVLDTEADCGPALECSAAMVSDFSAMMNQYLLLDKPVLWIQQPGKTLVDKQAERNSKWLVNSRWMEKASTADEATGFIERIGRGEDRNRDMRKNVRFEDLPLADGKAAERICNRLWDEMAREYLKR